MMMMMMMIVVVTCVSNAAHEQHVEAVVARATTALEVSIAATDKPTIEAEDSVVSTFAIAASVVATPLLALFSEAVVSCSVKSSATVFTTYICWS